MSAACPLQEAAPPAQGSCAGAPPGKAILQPAPVPSLLAFAQLAPAMALITSQHTLGSASKEIQCAHFTVLVHIQAGTSPEILQTDLSAFSCLPATLKVITPVLVLGASLEE